METLKKIVDITPPYDEEGGLIILTIREFLIPMLKEGNITWTTCKPQKLCFPVKHRDKFIVLLHKFMADIDTLRIRNASLIMGMTIREIIENIAIVTTIFSISVLIIGSIPLVLRQINPSFRVLKNRFFQIFRKKKKVVSLKSV